MTSFTYYRLLVLIPMVMLGALSMDIYLPAVPMMDDALATTPAMVQLTLSLFMLAFGLGQLFIGPLADRIGRRPIAIVAPIVFTLATIGCTYAAKIEWLIFWRCMAGLAACANMVVAFAMVRDSAKEQNRVFGYLTASIGLAPILSPILGALLMDWFGSWRVTFGALIPFGIAVMLATFFFLPETLSRQKQISLKPKDILAHYWHILGNSEFRTYTLAMTTHMTGLFCFFSASPIIIISVLGGSKLLYSAFFGLNAVTYTLSNLLATRYLDHVAGQLRVWLGIKMMLVGAIFMLLAFAIFGTTYVAFLIPQAIIAAGIGMIAGPGTALCIAPFPDMAGTATALLGALQFSLAGLFGAVMMMFPVHSPVPLSLTLIILTVLSLLKGSWLKRQYHIQVG